MNKNYLLNQLYVKIHQSAEVPKQVPWLGRRGGGGVMRVCDWDKSPKNEIPLKCQCQHSYNFEKRKEMIFLKCLDS